MALPLGLILWVRSGMRATCSGKPFICFRVGNTELSILLSIDLKPFRLYSNSLYNSAFTRDCPKASQSDPAALSSLTTTRLIVYSHQSLQINADRRRPSPLSPHAGSQPVAGHCFGHASHLH